MAGIEKVLDRQSAEAMEYYKSLGYTDAQSFTLATVVYGRNTLFASVMKEGKVRNFCKRYYDYILEHLDSYTVNEVVTDKYSIPRSLYEFFDYIKMPLEERETYSRGHATLDSLYTSGSSNIFGGVTKKAFKASQGFMAKSSVMSRSLDTSVMFSTDAEEGACFSNTSSDFSEPEEECNHFGFGMEEESYTDKYATFKENKDTKVIDSPTSSIRMTCNTASMGILKNTLETNPSHLDYSMVRIEEMLNYFDYAIPESEDKNALFNIVAEIKDIDKNKKYLMLGIKGKELDVEKASQDVVMLLDVSGSMHSNTTATQAVIFTLFSKLKDGDNLSLITYSSEDTTVFENLTVNKKDIDTLIEAIYGIYITGCTNGSAGINTAYKCIDRIAMKKHFVTNSIVLITDGELNFGVTSHGGLETLIKKKKKTGAFLSVIGTGTYNYEDTILETLAKNGNGNYCCVNTIEDVDESLNKNYQHMMFTLAKDVKAEIEFNPAVIKSYRLVGYENRQISHTEFKDDSVISEPFGRGDGIVVAYELTMEDKGVSAESDLKYQKPVIIDSDEWFTLKIRYRNATAADDAKAIEISKAFKAEDIAKGKENVETAFVISTLGKLFRGSELSDFEKNSIRFDFDNIESNKEKWDLLKKLYSIYCKEGTN